MAYNALNILYNLEPIKHALKRVINNSVFKLKSSLNYSTIKAFKENIKENHSKN